MKEQIRLSFIAFLSELFEDKINCENVNIQLKEYVKGGHLVTEWIGTYKGVGVSFKYNKNNGKWIMIF